ncbi:inhibitor of growth protein 3-like [Scaptodrosophila lebanonensis]|uniref:Inhibitor of growth protein n=1 Tax=Drosophila lebanonensis TaxID=7225 RepID=A0A6J2TSN5_DROLE|nr:inhibitor of growth protein 3-like [Scaptodrosophila lebanonensis]
MLYLEDYLEMIEHLPQELRDRFTEMRELDLAVQNNMDSLDKKSRLFFQQCKRGELQNESINTEFHNLRREYYKVMEDAEEKVAIATQIHELVERYLRRLDSELFKFKCELEADNNGITEILEKRSLELDGNNSSAATALLMSINQKENRYYGANVGNSVMTTSLNSSSGILTSSGGSLGTASVLGGGGGSVGGTSVSSAGAGITALSSLTSAQISGNAVGHPRHRKLDKRRETICTVPLPEKRVNLNHSLPTVSNAGAGAAAVNASANHVSSSTNNTNSISSTGSSNTHVTLPVAGSAVPVATAGGAGATVVRQLSSNLAAHGVLQSNAAATAVATNAGTSTSHPSTSTVSYNLQQLGGVGAASSAIAAAASQAIVATQQMQQGRRTASLKASYEAIHGAGVAGNNEFWTAANVVAAQSTIQPSSAALGGASSSTSHHHHHHHQEKKQKKKLGSGITMTNTLAVQSMANSSSGNSIASSSSSMSVDSVDMLSNAATTAIGNLGHNPLSLSTVSGAVTAAAGHTSTITPSSNVANVSNVASGGVSTTSMGGGMPSTSIAPGANLTIGENGLVVEQTNEGEWSYDPNEPRYCTCNQVSYGDMVACDNDACPYEWFHYPCVGITQPPKGKWYCPKCTASMRRRGNRKN